MLAKIKISRKSIALAAAGLLTGSCLAIGSAVLFPDLYGGGNAARLQALAKAHMKQPEVSQSTSTSTAKVHASPLKKMITGSQAFDSSQKLEMTDHKGNKHLLSDFKGRFVLVNVWATWCYSCRAEMPDLDALQGAFDAEKLLVMPLSVDRKGVDAVMPFYDRTNIKNLPIYIGNGVSAVHTFGERGIPFTIMLDPDGKEFGRILGPVKWDAPDFVEFLKNKVKEWDAKG